jgi:hypothetical protein
MPFKRVEKRRIARNRSNPPFSPRRRALSTWHRGVCLLRLQRTKALSPRQGHLNKRERQTETSVGVLGPDPLAPVLTEEHVRRERALGCLGVFFTCTATGSFLCLLGRLACLRTSNMSIDVSNASERVGMRGRKVYPAHLGLGGFFGHLGHEG